MPRYHATVSSSWPQQDTFDYLATFSNAAQWDPGVQSAERLDAGPVQVGSRFRLTVALLGRGVPLTYTVTAYEPPDLVVLKAVSPLLASVDRITVRPDGDENASVSYDADVRLRGLLGLLNPMLARGFDRVAGNAAAGLTQALSAERPRAGS
jgi:polyketide cyclase/dehydrase/lipid transport protein